MYDRLSICLVAGMVAFVATIILTPWIRRAAIQLRVGDYPGTRKVNTVFMPRLGGIAFIVGTAAGLMTASLLYPGGIIGRIDGGPSLAVAITLIIGLGIYDDVHGVGSLGKLLIQTIAALFVIGSGLRLETLYLPFVSPIHLGVAGPFLTLLWLIGITNAVNLVDGLDGLAAGVSILVALSFLAIGIHTHDWVVIASTVALIAACTGFLRYNFHPASIFMGDTGSLFLGFFLATLSLRIVHYHTGSGTPVSLLAVGVALAVPVVDTSVAFFRRLRKGMHPLKPDKEHIHHRIMDLGFTHRQTVVTIYAISAFNSIISLLLVQLDSMYAVVLLLVEAAAVFFGIRRLGYIEEMRSRKGVHEQAIQPLSVARVIDRCVLLCGDTFALVLAFMAAYIFRFASGPNPEGFVQFDVYFNSPAMLILTLGWLAAFALAGLYDIPWDTSRIDYMVNIVRVVVVGTVIIFIGTYDPEVMTLKGRLATFVYGGTVAFFVIFIRMAIVGIERRFNILGFRPRSTLLVGVSRAADGLLDDIARRPGLKYVLVGFVEREPRRTTFRGLPALGSYEDIPGVVRKHCVEEILVAAEYVSREEILDIVAQCNGMVPSIKVASSSRRWWATLSSGFSPRISTGGSGSPSERSTSSFPSSSSSRSCPCGCLWASSSGSTPRARSFSHRNESAKRDASSHSTNFVR
jgi:UDP-GlcNAc:undecaprenyl-phosphate GlcNAc-1-phosphate transferase